MITQFLRLFCAGKSVEFVRLLLDARERINFQYDHSTAVAKLTTPGSVPDPLSIQFHETVLPGIFILVTLVMVGAERVDFDCTISCNTQYNKKKGKGKGRYSSSWEPDLRATGRHLPYGITQCYLPPDTSERAPPNPTHAGWYSIYLPRRDGRLS